MKAKPRLPSARDPQNLDELNPKAQDGFMSYMRHDSVQFNRLALDALEKGGRIVVQE